MKYIIAITFFFASINAATTVAYHHNINNLYEVVGDTTQCNYIDDDLGGSFSYECAEGQSDFTATHTWNITTEPASGYTGTCTVSPPSHTISDSGISCLSFYHFLEGSIGPVTLTFVEEIPNCFDFSGIDFGACAMVLGVGLLGDECSYISGCNWTIDGIDYSDLFFDSIEECEENCANDNQINLGDINFDGEINILDVVLLVSFILGEPTDELEYSAADINEDSNLDVLDIVLLVDTIINQGDIPDSGLFVSQQYQEDELTLLYDIVYSERPNMNGLQYSSSENQQEDQLLDTILLELDIALPPNPEDSQLPMVMLIHGGGFHGGSKEGLWQTTKDYATLGYIACTINYRLTPSYYMDESTTNQMRAINDAVEDAMNAIRYLKTQSSIFNIDNDRIVTIGKSAGGFISLINAIENDYTNLLGEENISDYSDISSRVSTSVTTGAILSNLELLNFDEDDASCLIMHSEDFDSVTGLSWEDDVIPFYESVINSGNVAVLVAQPSNSHVFPVGPFDFYAEDIIPFIWNQMNLNEW